MSRNPTASESRAFTLIEILMAMAIFSLVVAAIYATWSAIVRGSQVAYAVAAQVQRERAAIQNIEKALTSARSFSMDVQHYGFIGQNGGDLMLSFVARLPKSFPRSGRFGDFDVRRVEFTLQEGENSSKELVLRQTPILMEFDEDEMKHPLVLARNVKGLTFDFWDTRLNDWTDTWAQTNQLPKLVRVTLQLFSPHPHSVSTSQYEEMMRIVALPSVAVPPGWQVPNGPRPPGQLPTPQPNPGIPNQTPGVVPNR